MRIRPIQAVLLASVVLPGCATSYPVFAKIDGTGERFIGQADSSLDGSSFSVVTANGVQCTGTYNTKIAWTPRQPTTSTGDINCSDGRVGTWTATGTTKGGQGIGLIDGEEFTIYFGDFVSDQQIR